MLERALSSLGRGLLLREQVRVREVHALCYTQGEDWHLLKENLQTYKWDFVVTISIKNLKAEDNKSELKVKVLVAQSCPTICGPVAHQAPLSMEFSSKNTGMGSHFLLQEIFPTQGSTMGPPALQADSMVWATRGATYPYIQKKKRKKKFQADARYLFQGFLSSVQSLSHVRFFATPWTAARQASLSITNFWILFKPMSIELVMPSNHLIFCSPLLLPPSIFPSIRVFSNESVLQIRWPKYWSFSFSISPSNEHSGLISFRMD